MATGKSPDDRSDDYDDKKPNHIIFWLDQTIGDPDKYKHLKKAFATNADPTNETPTMLTDTDYDRLMVSGDAVTVEFEGVRFLLQAFNNEEACLAAFEKNQDKEKRIFFITSGSLGATAVPKIIEKYRHIFTDPITDKPYPSVYVFCHNIEFQMEWGMDYYEYLQMFNFDSELLERMTRDIAEYFIGRAIRIREDNDLKGALQRLYWAKRLWTQYDKMQQQISTDNPRLPRVSQRMIEIENLIKQFEAELLQQSLNDENANSDEDGKGCEAD